MYYGKEPKIWNETCSSTPGMIVILARCFSGGETLAQRIHDCSGRRLVDEGVLIERAAAWGASHLELRNALHEPAPVPGLRFRRRETSRALIGAALAAEAESGSAVHFGNAGYLLSATSPPVLRIRLVAAMESRIAEACRRLGLPPGKAKARIHAMDRRQEKWLREVCGAGVEQSSLYDLVICRERVDLNSAAVLVAGLAADWTAPADGQWAAAPARAPHARL